MFLSRDVGSITSSRVNDIGIRDGRILSFERSFSFCKRFRRGFYFVPFLKVQEYILESGNQILDVIDGCVSNLPRYGMIDHRVCGRVGKAVVGFR